MKKQLLMTAQAILCALTLAVLMAVPLRAQSSEAYELREAALAVSPTTCDWFCQLRERQSQQLEGSWALTVTPLLPPGVPPIPPFRTYLTASRGGALIGSDRTRPFGGPQHGTWQHLGGNEFAATSVQDEFDAAGNFIGTLTVRNRITLTGADQFVSVASAEIRDAASNITRSVCATTKGDRIKVEPLAPQCQTITPPR